MLRVCLIALIGCIPCLSPSLAQEPEDFVIHDSLMDHGNGHLMDMGGGMVMGQNTEVLPGGCDSISEEKEITVRAGHKYSEKFPGTIFAFDQQQWNVKPCAKLTVRFINEDNIRHQFMVHGLPKYIYKAGMFHLEATGPSEISGTFIVPGYDQTYLVHCDISQHMEKGMKAQIVAGKGAISMPSIPGLTPQIIPDSYDDESLKTGGPPPSPTTPVTSVTVPTGAGGSLLTGTLIVGLAFGLFGAPVLARRFKGMAPTEIVGGFSAMATELVNWLTVKTKPLLQLLGAVNKQSILESIGSFKKAALALLDGCEKSLAELIKRFK